MRRESVAQMFLTIFVGQGRASSIVGDLLERDASVGKFSFWYSIAHIAIRSLGRPVLAFVLAAMGTAAFLRWVMAPRTAVVHHLRWMGFWLVSELLVLLIASIWCLVKYGWKDLFTLSILTTVGLGIIGFRFRGIFLVAPAATVLAASFVIFALCFHRGRRTLLALMLTIIGSELAFASVTFLDRLLLKAGWFSRNVDTIGILCGAIFLIVLIFVVSAWSRRITIEKPRGSSSRPVAA